MLYKTSQFNHFFQSDLEQDKWLAFNATGGESDLLYLSSSVKDFYDQISSIEPFKTQNFSEDEKQLFDFLHQHGFFKNAEMDEIFELMQKQNHGVENNHIHLVIMATKACNFACDYCFQSHIMHKENFYHGSVITRATGDEIIRYLENSVLSPRLFGHFSPGLFYRFC